MGIRTQAKLRSLMRVLAARDAAAALALLDAAPELATERLATGATRDASEPFFLDAIRHHVYAGDTALHVASAAHDASLAHKLIAMGADVGAKNRRGAEPLHYAADGDPARATWDPAAQAACVRALLEAGADPNAVDAGGVTPLHRAVRNRCSTAVSALLDGGADPRRRNKSGSSPRDLTQHTTGRGGSGSTEAKRELEEIVRLLWRRSGA